MSSSSDSAAVLLASLSGGNSVKSVVKVIGALALIVDDDDDRVVDAKNTGTFCKRFAKQTSILLLHFSKNKGSGDIKKCLINSLPANVADCPKTCDTNALVF